MKRRRRRRRRIRRRRSSLNGNNKYVSVYMYNFFSPENVIILLR